MAEEKDIEAAKQAAAGALGEKLGKFPLLFAKAVFFGRRPRKGQSTVVRNGTITLADLGSGPLGITCQHVLSGYREERKNYADALFQIGNVEIDPLHQLVSESAEADLAVFRLSDKQVKAITSDGEIGSCVFKPREWPSPPPNKGEFVAFGGFPGELREVLSFDEIEFATWSSGASEVSSVSERQYVSAFDRSYWIKSFGEGHHMGLRALGGMSGGPSFINRGLYWDLVGIIKEYHEEYDAMFFSSTRLIRQDGTIEPKIV